MRKRNARRAVPIVLAGLAAVVATVLAFAFQPMPRPQPSPGPTYSYDFDRPDALFLGDSYTQGIGADAASSDFATLVAENRKWVELNQGRGGTGYLATPLNPESACGRNTCPNYRQMLSKVQGSPDYVIVSGGRNDVEINSTALDPAVDAFFADLRSRFPQARVIVTSPIWDSGAPPEALTLLAAVVKRAARAHDADYLDIGEPLRGHRDWVVNDGIHPNDRGHAAIADAVIAALTYSGIGQR